MQTIDFQRAAETCVLTSLQQPKAGWFANQGAAVRMRVVNCEMGVVVFSCSL
jgi:hypothetical protein